MTRDDIIRMAREAGYKHPDAVGDAEDFAYFDFERFAALVAAAVEERLKWDGLHSCHSECDRPACVHTRKTYQEGYEAGRKDENEACAKVCDRFQARNVGMQPAECAGAIRVRREQ